MQPLRGSALATARLLRLSAGRAIKDVREAVGWSHRDLAERAGVSPAAVWKVEAGAGNVSLDLLVALCDALGIRPELLLGPPFLADRRRQREPAHQRCTAHVEHRLESAGWLTKREVEVVHGRSHGWIDLLAFRPDTRALRTVELKTEVEDLGRIERTLAWYEREARAAARAFGWRPASTSSLLLVLATEANERRLHENRESILRAFPLRAAELVAVVRDGAESHARGLALIDPRTRRHDWLIRPRFDGRRSPPPYADYADFMRAVRVGDRRRG